MADPTPPILVKRPASLDETTERCIGSSGWKQLLQALLVSLAWFFDAQQTFISVFTDAEPAWHCNYSIVCDPTNESICELPKEAWTWDWPAYTSTVSEWSLECAGSILTGLPASSFYMGCLAGGLALAALADSSLGRKNVLVLSCLAMSLSGLLTVVSVNVWMYSALRFLSGFGRATVGTCSLVLSTELVGKRWRGKVGILGFFCFTLGFLSLPALAYWNRGSSWRLLYLWTCLPAIIYCVLVHFLVSESPRWLYVRGRKEQFVETIRSIAPPANRSALTLSFFGSSFIELCEHDSKEEEAAADLYSAIKILWNKTWAFNRLIAVMTVGFGVGMVYYGMPLGVGNLAYSLYFSVTLNALSEVPASLVTFFLIEKLNRRSSLLGFCLLSGACSVICVMVSDEWKELQIGIELISFFSACTAFDVLLIYTLELFPTCVRNSAISMVRQALVLGGVFSPILVAAGRKKAFLSYGVFGVTIAFCGLFVGCLTETKGGTLCDTMDEEETKSKERGLLLVHDHIGGSITH